MDLPLPPFALELMKLTACENVLPSLPSLTMLNEDLNLSSDDEEKPQKEKPLKEKLQKENGPPKKRKRAILMESPEDDPCILKKTRPRKLRF